MSEPNETCGCGVVWPGTGVDHSTCRYPALKAAHDKAGRKIRGELESATEKYAASIPGSEDSTRWLIRAVALKDALSALVVGRGEERPFDELTSAEVNERIALRLGWYWTEKCSYRWDSPHWHSPGKYTFWHGDKIPDNWLHDDGLAFEDLWSKLTLLDGDLCIKRTPWGYRIFRVEMNSEPPHELFPETIADSTESWSEVICRAFCELVPLKREE